MFTTIENHPLDRDPYTTQIVEVSQELYLEELRAIATKEALFKRIKEFHDLAVASLGKSEKILTPILLKTRDWIEYGERVSFYTRQIQKLEMLLQDRHNPLWWAHVVSAMAILQGYLFHGLAYTADDYVEYQQAA